LKIKIDAIILIKEVKIMSKNTTMQDIAHKLNISINAVSIALNDKEGVSHELRMQILASEMNYTLKNSILKRL
jgi:DNA-binding LacI/PurR family transcriptional regulator